MLILKSSSTSKSNKKKITDNASVPITFIVLVGILCPFFYYYYFCYYKIEAKMQCKYITVESDGMAADHLLQYMHLYVEWKKNEERLNDSNFVPVIPQAINEAMSELFHNFSIPPYNQNCRSRVFDTVIEINTLPAVLGDVSYELQDWKYSYPDLISYGFDSIKKDLRFREDLAGEINTILDRISLKLELRPTFVCMHYAGVEYMEQGYKYNEILYNDPPTNRYYVLAMDYFENKYENIVFIFITSDQKWLKQYSMAIFANGFVVSNPIEGNDVNKDFVMMASCDHNIISHGIYSINAALLAGGETIAYAEYKVSSKKFRDIGDVVTVAKHMQDEWLVGNNSYIGRYADFYV